MPKGFVKVTDDAVVEDVISVLVLLAEKDYDTEFTSGLSLEADSLEYNADEKAYVCLAFDIHGDIEEEFDLEFTQAELDAMLEKIR